MTLAVNHNLIAQDVENALNRHYARLSRSAERLSTGLRVNSAADDAAGLAIRELMRGEISSLHQGIRNANDAISMLQTADEAMRIIDEKLIRMKELAEQAATGTYNSVQRAIINLEFAEMAAEIDRIANVTDFNGIHLLNGNLDGNHDGSVLAPTGKMKVHFGTGNNSAEDYYYVEIGRADTYALGLQESGEEEYTESVPIIGPSDATITYNDVSTQYETISLSPDRLYSIDEVFPEQGKWYLVRRVANINSFIMKIPKGTKNIIINANGGMHSQLSTSAIGDNDLQLYTESGKHLAGTVSSDFVFTKANFSTISNLVPFRSIDESYLNTGWADYNGIGTTGKVSTYNGMTIEYTGDTENHDTNPAYVNNGSSESYYEYEILKISEAREDLYVWYPGEIEGFLKVYYDQAPDNYDIDSVSYLSIATQEAAASSLTKIDNAIRSKDQIRAHLGAIQNRLENTITSLSIQAENMKSAEIRISDIDVASELYSFVRNKILTQSAVAMLSQAYTMPEMAMRLIVG